MCVSFKLLSLNSSIYFCLRWVPLQEQQQKQLELILTTGKASKLLESKRVTSPPTDQTTPDNNNQTMSPVPDKKGSKQLEIQTGTLGGANNIDRWFLICSRSSLLDFTTASGEPCRSDTGLEAMHLWENFQRKTTSVLSLSSPEVLELCTLSLNQLS